MREELMTEALCWEVESKVTANYAYRAKTTFDVACYCPNEIRLVRVHPKKRVNTYFYAPEKHVAGCPNEARSTEPPPYPGHPKPRAPEEPPEVIPNPLGPGLKVKKKSGAPTAAELLQFAKTVGPLPARHPGTLEEVIDAWAHMTPDERASQLLKIAKSRSDLRNSLHISWQCCR